MLDLTNIAKCGYCGKPIKPFTNQVLKEGEKRKVPKFYCCSAGCEDSINHRVKFIDKQLIEWIKERLEDKVGEFVFGYNEEALMDEFQKLTELAIKRRELQTDLRVDAFHAQEILEKLKKVEKKYDKQKKQLDTYDSLPFKENPLLGIIIEKEVPELVKKDINYRKKILDFMAYSIRLFNEFFLIRAVPITEEEYEVTKGLGPEFSINMRWQHRQKQKENKVR